MSGKHTPGLLSVKRGQFGSSVFVIYGADGFPIAQTVSNSSPEGMERARRGEHEENARRLALCWNTHDALLAALVMVRDADDDCIRDGLPRIPNLPRAKIDAAISRATGSTE